MENNNFINAFTIYVTFRNELSSVGAGAKLPRSSSWEIQAKLEDGKYEYKAQARSYYTKN